MFKDVMADIKPQPYTEVAPLTDFKAFAAIVQARRSIRVFKKDVPVPEQVIRQAIDMALLAPSSSNLLPYEFHWLRSAALKKQMALCCFGQPAATTAQELLVLVGRTNTWKAHANKVLDTIATFQNPPPSAIKTYYQKIVPYMYGAGPLSSVGLLKKAFANVAGLFRPLPREPYTHTDLKNWSSKSAALAAQNFMMAISAQGFDTCPMEGLDSHRLGKALGLGSGAFVIMGIAVGKRDEGAVYGPRMRVPTEWILKERT